MEFHHVGQSGLELLASSDWPTLASQSAGITGNIPAPPKRFAPTYKPNSNPTALCQGPFWPQPTCTQALECNNAISTHYSLHFLRSSDSPASAYYVTGITGAHHHAQLIFVFLVEMGFHHVGQAGLELLTSGDPPSSASQSAGITGRLTDTDGKSVAQEQSSKEGKARFTARWGFALVAVAGVQWQDLSNLHLLGARDSPASDSGKAEIKRLPPRWANFLMKDVKFSSRGKEIERGLTLSLMLACSDAIIAHCNLELLGSGNQPASASREPGTKGMGSCYVAQAGLELLTSSDLPALASQYTGITGQPSGTEKMLCVLAGEDTVTVGLRTGTQCRFITMEGNVGAERSRRPRRERLDQPWPGGDSPSQRSEPEFWQAPPPWAKEALGFQIS
ncbi:hypothetical protein AAY473_037547 [Plecturocebus cupreus]